MSGSAVDQRHVTLSPRAARRTPDFVLVAATIVACLPILALSQFAGLVRVDDIDAVFFAYYGKRILAGQRLYADLWDNKTPGIYWIDVIGLWISGGKFWGIALVVSLATLGTSIFFFLCSRRIFGLASAAIGTVMAALYINLYDYHVGANRPDTFYVFFDLAQLWFYLRAFDGKSSRGRNLFAAGACAACSVGFRQTAVAMLGAIAVHQVFLALTRKQRWADLRATALRMFAGAAAVTAAAVLVLWITSDLKWAWHGAVASNVGYVTATKQSRVLPFEIFHWQDHVRVLGLPAILAAAALIHAIGTRVRFGSGENAGTATWSDGSRRDVAPWYRLGGPPGVFVLLVAWVPIGWYLALIGPHRAHHYYAVALPPLVMLAVHGVWLLLRRDDDTRAPRYYVILSILWFGYMAIPAARHQVQSTMLAHFQRFGEDAGDRWKPTIDAILANTGPTETLYSMRYIPFVFWGADRPQAQRYLLDTLIDGWNERAQPYIDEVVAELKARPPNCIIASRWDMADMDARRDGKSAYTYRDLADWIRENYRLVNEGRGADVWVPRQ